MFYLIIIEYAQTLQCVERQFFPRLFPETNIKTWPASSLHTACTIRTISITSPSLPEKYFVKLTGLWREGGQWMISFYTSAFSTYVAVSVEPTNQESIDTNVSINWLLDWIKTDLSVWFWFWFIFLNLMWTQISTDKWCHNNAQQLRFSSVPNVFDCNRLFHSLIMTVTAPQNKQMISPGPWFFEDQRKTV